MIIGITGHRDLAPETWPKVAALLMARLEELNRDGITGVTSLAAGADQLFAFCVLAAGGTFRAVIPAQGYRATMTGRDQHYYDHLLALADRVVVLPFSAPTEAAYLAAGRLVADQSDLLLAVWDGRPAMGPGGTGDIAAYARQRGTSVEVLWPHGSARGTKR